MPIDQPEPTLTEADGVPVLYGQVPGPLRAGLILRVGTADETAPVSGITHLMEHLALFGLGRPGEHSNGSTDQTITLFHCVGDGALVTDFLANVTRQLLEPPADRLDAERAVLGAEAARRTASVEENLLTWRYGAQTYGVTALGELGLRNLRGDDVRGWAHRFANRSNAVVWLSGPPPAGLKLHLPDGDAQPAPDLSGTVLPQFPAWIDGPRESVALHAVLPRSYANQALAFVLRHRLVDELRTRRAVAYSPNTDYRPYTADAGRLLVASDLLAGRQSDGVRPFLSALQELSVPGAVTEDDLAAWRTAAALHQQDPMAGLDHLMSSAWQRAFQRPGFTAAQNAAGIAAVQPGDVAEVARLALGSALAQVPQGVRVTREPWVRAPITTLDPVSGRTHAHRGAPEVADTIEFSPEGLTRQLGDSSHLTVTTGTAVAVQHWADGRRVVIGRDANRLVVEPVLWQQGEQLVADIDRLWPADLRVDMGERRPDEIPKPPAASGETASGHQSLAPGPSGQDGVHPAGWRQNVWVRSAGILGLMVVVVTAVAALLVLAGMLDGAAGAGIRGGVIAGCVVGWQSYRRSKKPVGPPA